MKEYIQNIFQNSGIPYQSSTVASIAKKWFFPDSTIYMIIEISLFLCHPIL